MIIFLILRSEDTPSKTRSDTLLKDILEILECPVCREYMVPPIAMCESGHSICTICRHKLNKCPTCTKNFSKARNFALEYIAGKIEYPCRYLEFGCKETFSLEHIASHQTKCRYQAHVCPFSIVETKSCLWQGPIAAVESHVKAKHAELCNSTTQAGKYKTRLWSIENGPLWCRAMFSMDEVFFWYSRIIDTHLYSCVLFVGLGDRALNYKYRITINKTDGSGTASACHLTRSYLNDIEQIFQNCDCIVFHRNFIKTCMDAEKSLLVEIEILKSVP